MIIDQISLDDVEARVRHGHLSFMSLAMEKLYTKQINEEVVKNSEVIFAWGLLALFVFVSFDYFFAREYFDKLLLMRIFTVIPIAIISLYVLKNTEFGPNNAENVVCANIFASALTNIPLVYTANDKLLVFFYAAAAYLIALFYAQGFMTLRFWKTQCVMTLGMILYMPALPWDIILGGDHFDKDNVLHIVSLIVIMGIGIVSLYRRESLQRYNFIVRKQLTDEYKNLQEMAKQLEQLAYHDPLTNLYNRRAFSRVAREAIAISIRNAKPFAMILCDVDFFKRYNDHYGHIAGDLVLRQITELMTQSMRRTVDIVARFGGEEFVMLLPETDCNGAMIALRNMYDRLDAMEIPHDDSPLRRITLSTGVYMYNPGDIINIDDIDGIIDKADIALYKSKQTGRNRITFLDKE